MSWEWLKQLVGKIVAVGGTAVIYAVAQYILNTPQIELKGLLLVGSYALWSQGIAPVFNDLFKEQGQGTGTKALKTEARYFNLV